MSADQAQRNEAGDDQIPGLTSPGAIARPGRKNRRAVGGPRIRIDIDGLRQMQDTIRVAGLAIGSGRGHRQRQHGFDPLLLLNASLDGFSPASDALPLIDTSIESI